MPIPEFLEMFNDFAFIDIGLFLPAAVKSCNADKMPSDLKEALKLADEAHGKFIRELQKGKPQIKTGIKDFDLTKVLKYFDDESPDLKKNLDLIKAYFSGRAVDVVQGKGADKSDEGGFSFDYVLVLDPENKSLFSFILNLQD